MTATARQPIDSTASSDKPVAVRAVAGDRAALAELGRRGGEKRAERARQRKAEEAEAVILRTVEQLTAFVERRAGEIEASNEAASVKASAGARCVSVLTELMGLGALARENAQLRTECALLRARVGTGEGLRLTWSDDPDEAHATPTQEATPAAVTP